MRNEVAREAEVLAEKRGVRIYTSNPSVPSADEIRKPKRARLGNDMKGLVVDNGTGEILGHGGAMVTSGKRLPQQGPATGPLHNGVDQHRNFLMPLPENRTRSVRIGAAFVISVQSRPKSY